MRRAILAGTIIALTSVISGQASAQLSGFTTNETIRNWSSSGSSTPALKAFASKSKKAEARASNRSQRRPQRAARVANASDGTRPQRRAANNLGSGGTTGVASFYWQPQRVASGGWFNPNALTAAHRTLPFGTRVKVTHLGNGRSVVVKINDRGPFIRGRIIDLSKRAAGVIGMQSSGIARVQVAVLGR